MTQKEFVSYLTSKGWEEKKAVACFCKPIIDKNISVEEWRNTLVGAFCTRQTVLSAILKLAESLKKDVPQCEDLTQPNLSDFRDFLLMKVARNSTFIIS